GVADIIARCLRMRLEDRAPDIYSVLSDIRVFRPTSSARIAVEALDAAKRAIALVSAQGRGVFNSLALVELKAFERTLDQLEKGSVTLSVPAVGGRDQLVLKLCSYMSTLGPGDEYWAVTIPDFWLPRNLGVQGRYLSMNAEIV